VSSLPPLPVALLDLLRRAQQADNELGTALRADAKDPTPKTAARLARARAAARAAEVWRGAWAADQGTAPPATAATASRTLLDRYQQAVEDLLRAADVCLVQSSAGKDSLYILSIVVEVARRLGMLDKVIVVHCFLGEDAEWPQVAELARRQAEHHGVRFVQVAAPGGLVALIDKRGMFPDSARRLCTSTLKRSEADKAIAMILDALGITRHAVVLVCMGIRAEESPDRRLKAPLSVNTRTSSGNRLVLTWYPAFQVTQTAVWQRIRDLGLEYHPTYDALLFRLSCIYCVLAGKSHLVRAARLAKALGLSATERFLSLEERIQHTLKPGLSLARIVAEADSLDAAEGPLTWNRGDAIDHHLGPGNAARWAENLARAQAAPPPAVPALRPVHAALPGARPDWLTLPPTAYTRRPRLARPAALVPDLPDAAGTRPLF